MLNKQEPRDIKSYNPSPEEREFILKWYGAFSEDKQLKDQKYRCLGNTTLERFWQISKDNYDVIVPLKSKADWKRQAKRTITRDKANGFIAKMVRKIIYPQVLAQNRNQEIDVKASKILGILLEWWERKMKAVRIYIDAIIKCVIEGTIHIQSNVINGFEEREVVGNEEIFIPNIKQKNIQKQSHLIRAHITTYEEAKLVFDDFDNWDYVLAGNSSQWGFKDPLLNDIDTGIEESNEVLIVYLWEHTGYDKKNNPKEKLYNVLINGVPMYAIDNKLNLKHNRYPVSKTIFETFSDPNFYWGNSLANKCKHDQEYLDAFRTILLNKAILNLLPALMNKGGEHVDEDVIVPGKITPTQLSEGDIFVVPGTDKPITASDLNVEALVERSIDEGTQPPTSLGQGSSGGRTLGEIQLKDLRASELLETFGNMISFLVEDMAELSLPNILQFGIKGNIQQLVEEGDAEILSKKTIEISNQRLDTGETGILSLNFVSKGQHPTPMDILKQEKQAEKEGNKKEIVYVDPIYFEELDKFVYVSANPADKVSKLSEQLMTLERYQGVYRNNANIDQKEAVRQVIIAFNDDEEKLLVKEMPQMANPTQGGGRLTSATERMKQSLMPKEQVKMPLV